MLERPQTQITATGIVHQAHAVRSGGASQSLVD